MSTVQPRQPIRGNSGATDPGPRNVNSRVAPTPPAPVKGHLNVDDSFIGALKRQQCSVVR